MKALRNQPTPQNLIPGEFSGMPNLLIQQSGNGKLKKSCAKLISTAKNHSTKTSPIASDREINLWMKKKKKKFEVRLLQRLLKKLSHRTLLYLTSTHFSTKMMKLEAEKTNQIKAGNGNKSNRLVFLLRRLQLLLHNLIILEARYKKRNWVLKN